MYFHSCSPNVSPISGALEPVQMARKSPLHTIKDEKEKITHKINLQRHFDEFYAISDFVTACHGHGHSEHAGDVCGPQGLEWALRLVRQVL